ncbi:hypothetical protein [Lacrimispora sp.]|uniref:hypothetical protein n=1 Tax=Lacrimispora sp. TaxID=2719234 RepID=UPI0028993115|nr:hypothetical protein [Lacrimispora sp.]
MFVLEDIIDLAVIRIMLIIFSKHGRTFTMDELDMSRDGILETILVLYMVKGGTRYNRVRNSEDSYRQL